MNHELTQLILTGTMALCFSCGSKQAEPVTAPAKPAKAAPLAQHDFDKEAQAVGANVAVVFQVLNISATFPIRDMPTGYGIWQAEVEFIEAPVGSVIGEPGQRFTTEFEIYMGPVLSRPVGFWASELPKDMSKWVAYFVVENGPKVQELLRGREVRSISPY